jgi:outer membrane protein assembly factor BamB
VVAGNLIFIGSPSGTLCALNALSGAEAWTYSTGGPAIDSTPAAAGAAIFFGSDAGTIYSLSTDGALRWSTAAPGAAPINSPLCVANGVVYASDASYTYALDQNTGAVLAAPPVGCGYGGPAVVDGALFSGDRNDEALARYTPNGLQSNYIAPRPDPMQLRPHRLR